MHFCFCIQLKPAAGQPHHVTSRGFKSLRTAARLDCTGAPPSLQPQFSRFSITRYDTLAFTRNFPELLLHSSSYKNNNKCGQVGLFVNEVLCSFVKCDCCWKVKLHKENKSFRQIVNVTFIFGFKNLLKYCQDRISFL